jgi:hypothetical protein
MGSAASVSTTVNTTVNNIKTELINTAQASANINCRIRIGTITLSNVNGCVTSFENLCSANASAAVTAVQNAVYNVHNSLTSEQQNKGAAFLTATLNVATTVNTSVTNIQNYLNNTCQSVANVENTIEIMNFSLNNCSSAGGQVIEFKFINSGNAEANCHINTLMNLLAQATTEQSSLQVNSNYLETLFMWAGYVGIFLGGFIVFRQIIGLLKSDPYGNTRKDLAKKKVTPWSLNYDIVRTAPPSRR